MLYYFLKWLDQYDGNIASGRKRRLAKSDNLMDGQLGVILVQLHYLYLLEFVNELLYAFCIETQSTLLRVLTQKYTKRAVFFFPSNKMADEPISL